MAQDVENGYDAERSLRYNVRSRGQNLAAYPLGHCLLHWWPVPGSLYRPQVIIIIKAFYYYLHHLCDMVEIFELDEREGSLMLIAGPSHGG